MSIKNELDQYYTRPEVAQLCYKIFLDYLNLGKVKYDYIIEPSAGNGSFLNLFKSSGIGIDLDPKSDGILKMNFFEYKPSPVYEYVTLGNPPFGKNSTLAVKFFNRAAEFSNAIGFIVPKTFKKVSIHNKLNANFELKFSQDLEKDSFILNGDFYNVPTCFQIWVKTENRRELVKCEYTLNFCEFTTKSQANFAVRRVGGTAGKVTKDVNECSESTHYFFKIINNGNLEKLIELISSADFSKIVCNTAGVKSLSKLEFVNYFKGTL